LLQFISLQLNLAFLISSISLGNKKSKNNLHSIFVVVSSFIENQAAAKSMIHARTSFYIEDNAGKKIECV